MQYGICKLSIVPVRILPADAAEMVTQLLYGEYFQILEERGKWSKIRNAFDVFEGWISNSQLFKLEEEVYEELSTAPRIYSSDLIEFISETTGDLTAIPMGAVLNYARSHHYSFEGNITTGVKDKTSLVNSALLYLNTPFLWGGKSPFGIDSSGLAQMVYMLNGYSLLRGSAQQARQGEALSFIEECEPGDLAFFDDNEGNIIHVGIMMKDNYIIHADGKVRIDRIDHSGIFNADLKKHTHKLRVIKKII